MSHPFRPVAVSDRDCDDYAKLRQSLSETAAMRKTTLDNLTTNTYYCNSQKSRLKLILFFPRSSNGRTAGSGPVNRGSNPCLGTKNLSITLGDRLMVGRQVLVL